VRHAVVTGAGIRIGRAIALELGSAGFHLALHYHRSRRPAEETLDAVRAAGGDGFLVQADLGDPSACRALCDEIRARMPTIHVLVNNASAFEPVAFEAITLDQWDAMLAVNLRAPFLLSQGLLPALQAADPAEVGAPSGQGGLVVQMCDIGGDRPVRGYAHYSVSKAGMIMLVKAMAVELAPSVRTVGIAPGQVVWPESYSQERRDKLTKRVPMGRVGSAEDVARLVRFLALEAHYLNGDVIPVDGGLHCRY
jgi:pteridine reductase